MDVSIIIVNYNTYKITSDCINSVIDKTQGVEYEIILIDNASKDESQLHFVQDKRITYKYLEENIGFGKANNYGLQFARGEYIFLLNSDTVLVNNAVFELYSFLKNHKEFSIVGGQLYDKNFVPATSYSLFFPSLIWEFDILLRGCISSLLKFKFQRILKKQGYAPVSFITGADMMIRKSSIVENEFFDPVFFMYFEETELSYRYAKNKHYSCFFPQAQIIHLEGQSFTFSEKREKMFFESRATYYLKVHSNMYYKLSNIIYKITCCTRIILNYLFFNFNKGKCWKKRLSLFNQID